MDKKELKNLASKLLFDMKDNEYEILSKEFDVILKQMELINNIPDITKVEPMFYPFPIKCSLREDIVCDKLDNKDILVNAPSYEYDMIKVPKVVE